MTISNTTADNTKAKVGLIAGAEAQYQFTNIFGVTAGALYSMEGAKDKDFDVKYNLDYINVPILANVYPIQGVGLALKAGVQFGFNVRHKVSASSGSSSASFDMDNIKTLNMSIPVGISYEYHDFILDGRYNIGLSDLEKNGDAKSSVFTITLGYKFRSNKILYNIIKRASALPMLFCCL